MVVVIVTTVFVVLSLSVVLGIYVYRRRRHHRDVAPVVYKGDASDANVKEQRPLLDSVPSFHLNSTMLVTLTTEGKLIARDYVAIEHLVGKGHFGAVFKATLKLPQDDEPLPVAVKTINSMCT